MELNNLRAPASNERSFGFMGCDPEVFVRGVEAIFPAWLWAGEKPKTTAGITGAVVYSDGVQAEFAVPPRQCLQQLSGQIHNALKALHAKAKAHRETLHMVLDSVVRVSQKKLDAATEAQVALQCDPSENVYNMGGIPIENPREFRNRFAGGHIHFGLAPNKQNPELIARYVKMLDRMLGVWAVGVAGSFDKPIRRRYYGLAGQFRRPPHGLEYRTLSNFWLAYPALFHATFDVARGCINAVETGQDKYWLGDVLETIEIINNCDVSAARKVVQRNAEFIKIMLPYSPPGFCGGADLKQAIIDISLNGLESARSIVDPTDIATNWRVVGPDAWSVHDDPTYSPARKGTQWFDFVQREDAARLAKVALSSSLSTNV